MNRRWLDAGYDAESEDGPTWVRPLDILIRQARNAQGADCPKCGHHCKLFFSDPAGEHWCVCCQMQEEIDEQPQGPL